MGRFSKKDRECMGEALLQARRGLERGDFPVGAVLAIDGRFVGSGCNGNNLLDSWAEHAEAVLLQKYSSAIRRAKRKNRNSKGVLYTTLEPCLMCLGTSVLTRVGRIVYACPDPNGGATHINPRSVGEWYQSHWPTIQGGLFRDEAYEIVTEGMRRDFERWERILKQFEEMKARW